ncbi:hypothetical protein ACFL67_02085 [candidate division KSB1 bacterium]
MKRFLSALILLSLLFIFCNDQNNPVIPVPPDHEYEGEKLLYAFKLTGQGERGLFYSPLDSINFQQIFTYQANGGDYYENYSLYYHRPYDKIIAATGSDIFFIDPDSNIVLERLTGFSSSYSFLQNFGYGEPKIFPCHWSENYCVYAYDIVALINIPEMRIEKILYPSTSSGTPVDFEWFPDIDMYPGGQYLYSIAVITDIMSMTSINQLWKIDVKNGGKQVLSTLGSGLFYTNPALVSTKDFLLLYYPKNDIIHKYSHDGFTLQDSLKLDTIGSLGYSYVDGNIVIAQDGHNGKFVSLDMDNHTEEILMPSTVVSSNVFTFSKMYNGDLYACYKISLTNTHYVANLATRTVEHQFRHDGITKLYIIDR